MKAEGTILSTKDIAKSLVKNMADNGKSITMKDAVDTVNFVVGTITEEIVRKDVSGILFKNQFSIKKGLRKGREGSVNGHEYKSEDKVYLKISESKSLSDCLNK